MLLLLLFIGKPQQAFKASLQGGPRYFMIVQRKREKEYLVIGAPMEIIVK